MKPNAFFIVLALIVGGIGGYFCKSQKPGDDYRRTFYNGQILLPDYVHEDTLVVTNADFLNNAIKYVTTDSQISAVLAIACDTQ